MDLGELLRRAVAGDPHHIFQAGDYFNEMQRTTTSAENAVALQMVFADLES